MIYSSIRGHVAPGKLNEASAYLAKYAEGIKAITGKDVQVLGEVGEINVVMSVVTYEDMAEMEKVIETCWASEDYRKLMDDAEGLFSDSETRIMRTAG